MDTPTLFFVLAALLIMILIGYSIWSARREKSQIDVFGHRPVVTSSTAPTTSNIQQNALQSDPTVVPPLDNSVQENEQWKQQEQEIQEQVQGIRISLDGKLSPEATAQVEPVVNESVPEQAPAEEDINTENNLILLYVVPPQGQRFNGGKVASLLESLGLRHGENQIFHRHIDSAVSPILFSVANMREPWGFDLANLDQFETDGLVFFMQLPSPTNDLANLRLMIGTADSFSRTLGGFIFNDQQQLFDEASYEEYLQRVKAL